MKQSIYVDFNATTPLGKPAREAMLSALDVWGNPSSSHRWGREAREQLEKNRRVLAEVIGTPPSSVVFTSGGAESNHSAILGVAGPQGEKTTRILASAVEHSSIHGALSLASARGALVEMIAPNSEGIFSPDSIEEALERWKPNLLTINAANSETGVTTDVLEISKRCKKRGVLLHVDAVQAFGKIPQRDWNCADLISLSAHKVYGPKGCGALIVRNEVALQPLLAGGAQETKRRAGTQNLLGIAGFAAAASNLHLVSSEVRDSFERAILNECDGILLIGSASQRVPNTSLLQFAGIPSEVLLSALDLEGIAVSAGSACSSGSLLPSRVVQALGYSAEQARQCLRFSWGISSTIEEAHAVAARLGFHVKRIRERRNGGAPNATPAS